MKCGKLIKCWDHQARPCIRLVNHEYGCNPFSNSIPHGTEVQEEAFSNYAYPAGSHKPAVLVSSAL